MKKSRESFNKSRESFNKSTGSFNKSTGSLKKITGSFNKSTESFNKITGSLKKITGSFNEMRIPLKKAYEKGSLFGCPFIQSKDTKKIPYGPMPFTPLHIPLFGNFLPLPLRLALQGRV